MITGAAGSATSSHAARVTQLALRLAEEIAPELALDRQLAYGFRLHDIGMIGVSNATLLKAGSLTPAEIDEIRDIRGSANASSRPGPPSAGSRGRSSLATTNGGTARVIRAACEASRSPSPPGCSLSWTSSMR